MSLENELAILLTGHPKHQKFWENAMMSWEGCPYYILLAYDDIDMTALPIEKFPMVKDVICSKVPAGQLGHAKGELTLMQLGGKFLANKGYKYIFKSAADTAIWKWNKIQAIHKLMIGANVKVVQCGTAIMYAELEAFNQVMEPFYKDKRLGSAELFFTNTRRNLHIKSHSIEDRNFWGSILGRVHVQGSWCRNNNIGVADSWKIGEIWRRK